MQMADFGPDRRLAALLLLAMPLQGAPACGRGWATRRRRVPPPPAHTPPPATAGPGPCHQSCIQHAGVELTSRRGQGTHRWFARLPLSEAATEAAPPPIRTNVCKLRSPQQRDCSWWHPALERHSQPALEMCGGLGWDGWAGLHAVGANRREELARNSRAAGENSKHRRLFAVPRCLPCATQPPQVSRPAAPTS